MVTAFDSNRLSQTMQLAWAEAELQLKFPDPNFSRRGWCGRNELVARMMKASGAPAQSCLNVLNEAARKGAIERIMVDKTRPSKGVMAFRWPGVDGPVGS